MALSKLEVGFLARALAHNVLPTGGDMLELGESTVVHWVHPLELLELVRPHLPADRCEQARERIAAALNSKVAYRKSFGPARALYEAIFQPSSYLAVDMDVGPRRVCADLNAPLRLGRQFACVINNGTSEHVFDQAQTFKSMHDQTAPGGTMLHWTPCIGWVDHGLYSVQPGFFFDLAAANSYEVRYLELANEETGCRLTSGGAFREALKAEPSLANSQVCAVLRKTVDAPFVPPMQGMYVPQAKGLAAKLRDRPAEHRTNLALGRPAMQSSVSTWSWGETPEEDAGGACDGSITGYYSFHTAEEDQPWWMVDLGHMATIAEVIVYNRIDGGAPTDKSARLMIAVSLDREIWQTVYAREERQPFGGADGRPLRVTFKQPVSGRYVRLSLPGRTMLHLDEVEIY